MNKKTVARLASYEDVRQILDAALAAGGGEVELETPGKAVHWRQRAYRFRKLYAEEIGGANSKYHRLTFPKLEPNSNLVKIKMMEQRAIFRPKEILPEVVEDDELLGAANEVAKALGLDKEIF